MKSIGEFLSYLKDLDIKLWVEGDRLRCNAPKDALIPVLRAELAERKEEILKFLHKTNLDLFSTPEQIPSIPRDRKLPLSFAQQRLWFLDQLEERSSTIYNKAAALRLVGQLHIAVLKQSLNEIIRRHEILRTTFPMIDGTPVQAIASSSTVSMALVDLQLLPKAEQNAEVQRLATSEAQLPFNLAKDPLLRITLLRLVEEEHVLLVTMHHIISDGWSSGIFIRELSTLYEAFSQKAPSPLSELPIQYADFAYWQRQWLSEEVHEIQLNYWKQQLAGASPLLYLPTDRPRPSVQTFQGGTESFKLSANLAQKLKTLSQRAGATLFMTLLAAFVNLLSRYSSQEDIVVGSPVANRNHHEIEPLIGFFVNTIVLRTNLQGNPTFQEVLARVKQMALEAYAHQDLPFEHLVEALQLERDLSHSPLFQVMFVLQNVPMEKLELPNLSLIPLELDNFTAKFDLTLSITETESGLIGLWEYNSDLFESTTIRQMTGHFQTLLEAIVAHPQQRISELPLLTAAERQQLLVEWNNTQTEYPRDQCIHQLFEAQVEQTPDAVALVFEKQQLTYHELNSRANQLANYLRTMGVGVEVLVGICLERSLEMIVGLLAILKAGGAYVPLDSKYPAQRLAYMLEDSAVSILLSQKSLLASLPEHQARVLCLDSDWQFIANHCPENPVSGVKPDNLAYVIYTSGSTGKPKGTLIIHQGLVNYLTWAVNYYQVAEGCGAPVNSSIAFDATITSIFSPLLVGKKVVLLPETEEIEALASALNSNENFSLVKITPAHLDILSQLLAAKELKCQTRAFVIGGEALTGSSLAFWRTHLPNTRFINEYGPTETVVGCCIYEVTDQTSLLGRIPIGRPIANSQLYILDKFLQPVPVGVTGELYIGGVGVARGYKNCLELTNEKFIPHSLSQDTTSRLYQTGDLARYLPNGDIEYLGRIDNQVKLRGFRIELGEIEAVLNSYPQIEQAVVIPREDIPGNQRLVAYLVAKDRFVKSSEWRNILKKELPEFMIPSVFVFLEKLPLTPNGKVDRRALPAPELSQMELENSFVPPRTSKEKSLAVIWAKVLRLERIGIHNNFFELGGDSILSIQVVTRANQAGLRLTPKQLFQHQTIAELATVAGTTTSIQAEQGLVTGPVPLTPIQHWFFEQNLAEPHHFNQSVLLDVPPDLKPKLLKQVVQQLLAHHDALRLRFMFNGSTWQQVNAVLDETVPFTIVDLSKVKSDEQQTAIEAAAASLQACLNLSEVPLMQTALFLLGNDKPARLLFIIHHLVVDGVSWRILFDDLTVAYQQLNRGEAIQLPSKTTSFKDWANRLLEYGQSAVLGAELDYWLTQIRSNIAPLPVDYLSGRKTNTVASTAQVSVSLNEEQTYSLLQKVPSAYNTQINEVLLTALVQSFSQWTGERVLLVDLEGHGREDLFEDVDLSRTVGWFTTIFPVFLQLEGVNSLGKALKSIKEQLRRLPKRGIGYGLLRYLNLNQDTTVPLQLQALPQAEVSFNYLGHFDQVQLESVLLGFAKESKGNERSLKGSRNYLLEINGLVVSGRLQMNWIYSNKIHQRDTVERLALQFIEVLQALIDHCQSPDAGGYTPSDFPEVELNQEELDALLAEINEQ